MARRSSSDFGSNLALIGQCLLVASAIRMVDGCMDQVDPLKTFQNVRISYCKQPKKGDVVSIWSVSNQIWVKANVDKVTADYVDVLYEVSAQKIRKVVMESYVHSIQFFEASLSGKLVTRLP